MTFYGCCLCATTLASASISISSEQVNTWLPRASSLHALLRDASSLIFAFSAVLTTVALRALSWVEPTTKQDKAVKALLDDFKSRAFADALSSQAHRVTLFRFYPIYIPLIWKRKKLPWCGCLLPYERADEYTLNPDAIFVASKDRPEKCEGVAGRIFRDKKPVKITFGFRLTPKPNPNKTNIRKYADETGDHPDYIERRLKEGKEVPASFWGTPIDVDGMTWGVLIIDSQEKDLPDSEELKRTFRPVGMCLSQLFSNAG